MIHKQLLMGAVALRQQAVYNLVSHLKINFQSKKKSETFKFIREQLLKSNSY
jgi:hypothetical protein